MDNGWYDCGTGRWMHGPHHYGAGRMEEVVQAKNYWQARAIGAEDGMRSLMFDREMAWRRVEELEKELRAKEDTARSRTGPSSSEGPMRRGRRASCSDMDPMKRLECLGDDLSVEAYQRLVHTFHETTGRPFPGY